MPNIHKRKTKEGIKLSKHVIFGLFNYKMIWFSFIYGYYIVEMEVNLNPFTLKREVNLTKTLGHNSKKF